LPDFDFAIGAGALAKAQFVSRQSQRQTVIVSTTISAGLRSWLV